APESQLIFAAGGCDRRLSCFGTAGAVGGGFVHFERRAGELEAPFDAVVVKRLGHGGPQRAAYHVLEYGGAKSAPARTSGGECRQMFAPRECKGVAGDRPVDRERARLGCESAVLDRIGREFVSGHAQNLGRLGAELYRG